MTQSLQPVPLQPAPGPDKSPIKKFFLRGAILLLPTIITVWLIVQVLAFLQRNLVRYAARLIAWCLEHMGILSPASIPNFNPETWLPGVIIAWLLCLFVIVFTGIIFGGFLGRRIWVAVEGALMQLPPMRFIYPYVKSVTDFFFSEKTVGFRQVVAVEYPYKGVYSIGFVTGCALPTIDKKMNAKCLSVFVPHSPTPMTGYVVFIPESEVLPLPITMEEALKVIVSCGVVGPETPSTDAVKSPTRSPIG